ncbi:hypothetical protein KBC79_03490 [Candidatus Woesebacteria bacterium]|nr:hypothetical protein [Candidatus Woesebacteria bacterium]
MKKNQAQRNLCCGDGELQGDEAADSGGKHTGATVGGTCSIAGVNTTGDSASVIELVSSLSTTWPDSTIELRNEARDRFAPDIQQPTKTPELR